LQSLPKEKMAATEQKIWMLREVITNAGDQITQNQSWRFMVEFIRQIVDRQIYRRESLLYRVQPFFWRWPAGVRSGSCTKYYRSDFYRVPVKEPVKEYVNCTDKYQRTCHSPDTCQRSCQRICQL